MASTALRYTKLGIMTLIYLYLAAFILFIAVRTYQFNDGFGDLGTIAVVVAMVALFLLIARLGIRNLSGSVRSS